MTIREGCDPRTQSVTIALVRVGLDHDNQTIDTIAQP